MLFNFTSGSNEFDVSSRTLKTLKGLQDEGRSLFVKAQKEVQAFGAYATSKALADSQLLLSVTIVVASELAQILSRPLLPSSPSSKYRVDVGNQGQVTRWTDIDHHNNDC